MKYFAGVLALLLIFSVVACSSPEDRAALAKEQSLQADTKLKEERLKMLEEYRECVKSKPSSEAEDCDYLLKAIEAVQ